MVLTRFADGRITLKSFEEKPLNEYYDPTRPTILEEPDTRRKFTLNRTPSGETVWAQESQETLNIEGEEELPVCTSLAEFGDNFPHTEPLVMLLLDGNANDIMGNVTMTLAGHGTPYTDLAAPPFEGYQAFNADSHFLTGQPTTGLADKSFFGGFWFRSTSFGGDQVPVSWGQRQLAQPRTFLGGVKMEITGSGLNRKIGVTISDGTNTVQADLPLYDYLDGNLYRFSVALDRKNKKVRIAIGNKYMTFAKKEISYTTMGSLDSASHRLVIGGIYTTGNTPADDFVGDIFNVQFYKFADDILDAAVIRMFNMGICDAPVKGMTATLEPGTISERFQNHITFSGSVGSYIYYPFLGEAGIYDFMMLYNSSTTGGKIQAYIDGAFSFLANGYTSATGYNHNLAVKETLTRGIHWLKIKITEKRPTETNGIFQMIMMAWNKRAGGGKPDTESGSSTIHIYGDQLTDRSGSWAGIAPSTENRPNHSAFGQTSTPALTDYLAGTIKAKRGLYQMDFLFLWHTDAASVDIHLDGVHLGRATRPTSPSDYSISLQAYLTGKPQKLKLTPVASSLSQYHILLNVVNLDILEDYANDPMVGIFPADRDYLESAAGTWALATTAPILPGSAKRRFATSLRMSPAVAGDVENSWERLFSGGEYEMTTIMNSSGSSIPYVKIDDVKVFTNPTTGLSFGRGQKTILDISRGKHKITVGIPQRGAAYGDIDVILPPQFTLLARTPVPGDRTKTVPDLMQLVGKIRVDYDRHERSINIAGIPARDNARLFVRVDAEIPSLSAGGLGLLFNGLLNMYHAQGYYMQSGTPTTSPDFTYISRVYLPLVLKEQADGSSAAEQRATGKASIFFQLAGTSRILLGTADAEVAKGSMMKSAWEARPSYDFSIAIDPITQISVRRELAGQLIRAGAVIKIFKEIEA